MARAGVLDIGSQSLMPAVKHGLYTGESVLGHMTAARVFFAVTWR
jgi:hypothetical protein